MKVDYRLLSKTCSRAFKAPACILQPTCWHIAATIQANSFSHEEHYCPPEIDIFIEGAAAPGRAAATCKHSQDKRYATKSSRECAALQHREAAIS